LLLEAIGIFIGCIVDNVGLFGVLVETVDPLLVDGVVD
jgi:hypothetical protein